MINDIKKMLGKGSSVTDNKFNFRFLNSLRQFDLPFNTIVIKKTDKASHVPTNYFFNFFTYGIGLLIQQICFKEKIYIAQAPNPTSLTFRFVLPKILYSIFILLKIFSTNQKLLCTSKLNFVVGVSSDFHRDNKLILQGLPYLLILHKVQVLELQQLDNLSRHE
jgi:hypothetical protein